MDFSFQLNAKDKRTRARLGVIKTPHGEIQTPAYTPVATTATVKALDTQDLIRCNSQVVLANTYHLLLRPGLEVLEQFGGFAPFMKWDGPTITDSGGYQVSFLRIPKNGKTEEQINKRRQEGGGEIVKIMDEGATFRSYVDGSKQLITPEKSMEIQSTLNADIIMAFDQPLAFSDSPKKLKDSIRRTFLWEERSFSAWQKIQKNRETKGLEYQALYGIVQGQLDKKVRREFMQFILDTGFPAIAVGDQTIGVDPKVTGQALDTIVDMIPDDKPVHALGLGGGPEGIFEAVSRGVDTFDNTSVTRIARSGLLYIYPEDGGTRENKFRLDITRARHKSNKEPVSKVCACYTCQNYSAAYIHHLLVARELSSFRLASIHNVHFMNDLMARIRVAIKNGEFEAMRREWAGTF